MEERSAEQMDTMQGREDQSFSVSPGWLEVLKENNRVQSEVVWQICLLGTDTKVPFGNKGSWHLTTLCLLVSPWLCAVSTKDMAASCHKSCKEEFELVIGWWPTLNSNYGKHLNIF